MSLKEQTHASAARIRGSPWQFLYKSIITEYANVASLVGEMQSGLRF